MRGPEHLM